MKETSKHGKNFNLFFTVEHTYHDEEVCSDWSNIHTLTRENLAEALELVNLFQSEGYKNISISYEVRDQENWLFQETISDLDLKVNHSVIKDLKKTETVERLNDKYKNFIEENGIDKHFAEYMNN